MAGAPKPGRVETSAELGRWARRFQQATIVRPFPARDLCLWAPPNASRFAMAIENTLRVLAASLLVMATISLGGPEVKPAPPPSRLYDETELKFTAGDLRGAFQDAEFDFGATRDSNPTWACRFRVLQAEILVEQGHNREALTLLQEKSPALVCDHESSLRRTVLRATASADLRDFAGAGRLLQEAGADALAGTPPVRLQIAQARAVAAWAASRLDEAEMQFREALQLAREQHDSYQEARSGAALGGILARALRCDDGIDVLTTSKTLSVARGYRALEARALANLGYCYSELGDDERALPLYLDAEAMDARLGLDRERLISQILIGLIYQHLGQYGEANRKFQDCIDLAARVQDSPNLGICLQNVSEDEFLSGDLDRAQEHNRQVLELKRANHDRVSELFTLFYTARILAARRDFGPSESLYREVIESTNSPALRYEAESRLATLYAEIGKPEQAEKLYRRFLATLEATRSSVANEEFRLSFLKNAHELLGDYIGFLIAQGRARDALQVADFSRARTLAEGLGLKETGPSFSGAPFRPEATARALGTTILAFWLKPERSWMWAVTPAQVELFALPPIGEIQAAVREYREAIVGGRDGQDAANRLGLKLYSMLVAPAEKLIPLNSRVAIIADNALNGLNFETLLAPMPSPHYWIEDVTLTQTNSIALLAASGRRHGESGSGLLLIGDPVSPNSEYPELAHAREEIDDIRLDFPGERSVVVARDRAMPRAYRENEPGGFAYIHFVAHATASRLVPLDSGVILSRDGEEYRLSAREIMRLPLRARLVTISACYGAGARAYSGEGLVGLAWAFLRAGAHHVIAALWEVNDASTPILMRELYRNLNAGQDPATALRGAKLALLHSSGRFRRPFYWAAFELYTGA